MPNFVTQFKLSLALPLCFSITSIIPHLLLGQRRKISRILWVRLPTRRTQLVLVGPDPVPAEPADLVATRARVEVQVVHLDRLHAQRTLGRLILAIVERVHPKLRRPSILSLLLLLLLYCTSAAAPSAAPYHPVN